tara:strand:+ start:298 stop:816 length:519 start_codon:yes stop_codon:yes gene_type:complete
MSNDFLYELIKTYPDFPKKGILFRDILPILEDPKAYKYLIERMSNNSFYNNAEAIISIDARGFLFGSAISFKLDKPHIVARKPGKLPGELLSRSYDLEYGTNSLSIQKDTLDKYNSFVIVDDLLATGGTVECIKKLLIENNKKVCGLNVVIELKDLNGRDKLKIPVESELIF